MEISVRSLAPEDYTVWQMLWQGYLTFYDSALEPEVTSHLWQQFFHEHKIMHAFVIENNQGQVCGFAHCVLHPNTWSVLPCCYLEDLYVAPGSRGKGYASALIKHVQKFAQAVPCNRLYWVSMRDNEPANKLYNQLAQCTDFIQFRMPLNAS